MLSATDPEKQLIGKLLVPILEATGEAKANQPFHIMSKNLTRYKKEKYNFIEFHWDDFIEDFKNVLDYHKDAIVKKSDISSRSLSKINIPEKMTYIESLKILWNNYKLFQKSHYFLKDEKDENGNLILIYNLEEQND